MLRCKRGRILLQGSSVFAGLFQCGSLRHRGCDLFLLHEVNDFLLLVRVHVGQLHRRIKGQFFVIHLLLQLGNKGINTDKALNLVAAHAHIIGYLLIGTLLGRG